MVEILYRFGFHIVQKTQIEDRPEMKTPIFVKMYGLSDINKRLPKFNFYFYLKTSQENF